MCGFVGFIDNRPPQDKKQILTPMMERIRHRGPDMAGRYADDTIALGFRRLSIIDLSKNAAQPIFNEDKSIVAVFNGEIYNFMDIRELLEEQGHVFVSNADSEVIVHGFEEFGEKLVPMLRGMFSFVVWDTKNKKMFASRDAFGIKPFQYCRLKDNGLVFGSEIKCFLDHPDFEKQLDPDALRPYLSFQYPAGDCTFFKGVYNLPPGHNLWVENGNFRIECYNDLGFAPDESLGFEQSAKMIDDTVRDSVKKHSIGDVEIGCFLSGGVDSSYITTCHMPKKTFSVGFEQNKFNETNYAAELSEKLGIHNIRKLLTAEECFEAFPEIQYHMDQPQSNPSNVPLWFLSKLASEHVSVVLSGEGADEIFGGYELYADTPAMEKYKRLPVSARRIFGKLAKAMPPFKGRNFLMKSAERPEDWFIGQAQVFSPEEALKVLKPAYKSGPSPLEVTAPYYAKSSGQAEITKKQYLDLHLWMPGDILVKADRMCMAHSLELRTPLLDLKVMELASVIPPRYYVQGTKNKMVFRHAANMTLPDEWANRPKKGFPVPIRHWLREKKYYDLVKEYFTSSWAEEFFNIDKIVALLDSHYDGSRNNGRKIWTVFTFLVWYKRFFIDEL